MLTLLNTQTYCAEIQNICTIISFNMVNPLTDMRHVNLTKKPCARLAAITLNPFNHNSSADSKVFHYDSREQTNHSNATKDTDVLSAQCCLSVGALQAAISTTARPC